MTTARQLAEKGFKIFRAGVWKPRTKPGGFEGMGEAALPWLQRVKEETGMLVSTEVAMPKHVEASLKAGVDLLWVGARTTANPFAMQELADSLKGVEHPSSSQKPGESRHRTLDRCFGAHQRSGHHTPGSHPPRILQHRPEIYRNAPMWHIPIELHRRFPNLPVICDPSHIGGRRDLIAPLCQQAMDMGFSGLIVESHCNPDCAWSDAKQQVMPDVLDFILDRLVIRENVEMTESLSALRKQIDELDNELMNLLTRRMRVSREIATYKKEHDMAVVQTGRYSEILDKRGAQGVLCGMDAEFVKKIYEAIHEESVRQQMDIINK